MYDFIIGNITSIKMDDKFGFRFFFFYYYLKVLILRLGFRI